MNKRAGSILLLSLGIFGVLVSNEGLAQTKTQITKKSNKGVGEVNPQKGNTVQTENVRGLPIWFDPAQENTREYEKAKNHSKFEIFSTKLPQSFDGFVPPEYVPLKAVVLGWNSDITFLSRIAKAAVSDKSVEIWATGGPTSPPEGVDRSQWKSLPCRLDSMWMRDYGPIAQLPNMDGSVLLDPVYRNFRSRPRDDAAPGCIAKNSDLKSYTLDVTMDGGNFMVDSFRTLYMTSRTYAWNSGLPQEAVDAKLKQGFGVQKVVSLPYAGFPGEPEDGTGHIDMFVKLLADDVVLVSTANEEPYSSTVEAAAKYFLTHEAGNGKPFKVIRVPGFVRDDAWHTYTNSLLVNGRALVPQYSNDSANEDIVREVYKLGGFEVDFIPSDSAIALGGSVHCVTQNIPKN